MPPGGSFAERLRRAKHKQADGKTENPTTSAKKITRNGDFIFAGHANGHIYFSGHRILAKASVLCSAELATLDKIYDNVAGYPYAKDWKAFREQGQKAKNEQRRQQETKVSYSLNDNNSTGIKQQLQNHLDELNAMEPVVTINSQAYAFKNKSDLRKQLTQEFEKSGAIVDRQGFGKVIFDETAMSQIVGYISLSDTAGLLAIKAAPAVVKRGLEIDRQINFKNRGFDTVTFAAPVKINGTRGNVAVVVRMIKNNRAHCVRIVLPDGSAFKIDNKKADTMSVSGLGNQVQKRNGSAHKNNIPQSEQIVKKNFSLNDKQKNDFRFSLDDSTGRELSEGQREYFKDSVICDEQGRLKVMYRGGRESFTVFDRKKASHSNLYGRGFYFTDSESHARQYGDVRAYYLKVTNPVSTEQTTITRAQLRKFLEAVAQNEDYGLDNYGYGSTVDSVLKNVYGSRSDFAMLYDKETRQCSQTRCVWRQ